MDHRPSKSTHTEIADYERRAAHEHHHRGKSSESLLDKEAILRTLRISPECVSQAERICEPAFEWAHEAP